jgi:ribosome recycling factor
MEDFTKIIDHLKYELNKIKTGRANSDLIENIMVSAYNSQMSLKELASISIPEARQLLVIPFDKSNLKTIQSALNKADLGTSPQVQGDSIRIILPPLTEESRLKEVANIKVKAEEAKVRVREIRHKILSALKKDESKSEEDQDREKKQTEDMSTKFNEEIEKLIKTKEEEVMKI